MGNSILASRVCLDINSWVEGFKHDFYLNFIKDDRYMYLLKGLWMTLQITFFAVLIGIALGVVAAIVRSTHDKIIDEMRPGLRKFLLKFFNAIVKIYLTVIRGTPVVVQLLIMYYVIFASSTNQILIAVLAFGINSGAYVAEIFRSGIMSIDNGQFEAGRSLGFNYIQTMIHIIIPQAFKNVLPALANEFIVLIKETSISGYVGIQDLTRGGDVIRSRTFSAFMPLIAVACIYLVIVIFFTKMVTILERRLRNSER
jgi:amine acid ABC transporter, permease protein, 3-TM region, His/Glu/Gln/Arg/opine family